MQFLKYLGYTFLLVAASAAAAASDADAASWATEEQTTALLARLDAFFDGAEVRLPGSPGNLEIEARVRQAFAASGFDTGEIRMRTPRFLPGRARLVLPDGGELALLPLHPSLMRPGNLEERRLEVDLVYLGRGSIRELAALKGVDLRGAFGVMEMSCGADWQELLRFGLKGFIFLGSGSNSDAVGKVHGTEIAVPRFWVQGAGENQLRDLTGGGDNSAKVRVTIESEPSRWENCSLRNLWVFVPGSDPELEKDVVLVTAPMDANCVVPELAVGAQSGANLFLLMELLARFREQPPARSVLLAAVNAHTQNYKGERLLAWNLLAPIRKVEELRNVLAGDMVEQELMVSHYSQLHLDGEHRDADEELLVKWRTLTDRSTGRYITVKDPIVDLVKRDVNRLRGEQLSLYSAGLDPEEVERRRAELEERREKYVNVLTLFNRVGVQTTLTDLYERSPESLPLLRGYVDTIVSRNRRWAELNRRDLEISSANTDIRRALEGRKVAFALTLDMDWMSPRIGFTSASAWTARKNWPDRFGRNSVHVARNLPAVQAGEKPDLFVDTMTGVGGLLERHYFPVISGGLGVFHAAEATPAFSLRNIYTHYGRAFTPEDTFDNLDGQHVGQLMHYVPELLRALLADPGITAPSELIPFEGKTSKLSPIWSVQIKTFRFDEFAASVMPSLPVTNSTLVICPTYYMPWSPYLGVHNDGTIKPHIALTDGRAAEIFYGLQHLTTYASTACRYDPDFIRTEFAIDAGEVHERVSSNFQQAESRTLALFECKEIPIYVKDDPSLISAFPITVNSIQVLSATRDAAPRRYGFSGINALVSSKSLPATPGPYAVYADRGDRLKLLTQRKRPLINATQKDPEGEGFRTTDNVDPDYFAMAAQDLSLLNRYRIRNLRGVSDELAQDFLRRGDESLESMRQARTSNDHTGYLQSLYKALGAHVKAYEQTVAITNDMLKAVVFYMALLLPFCFFFQKLIFKFVKIEVQMAAFAVIFVMTFVVFRAIHPAFRIAQAPEAMFVAFVMGMLGAFVIKVLHDRFEGEMQLLFQTYSGVDMSDVAYSTVGQQAMLIGVNNMKRRRIRTALTTATIVLVTFTMLSFSSISKKMSPTIVNKSKTAPYTGLMYHWPGMMMDEASAQAVEALFAGQGDTIMRRWLLSPRTGQGTGHLEIPMHAQTSPQGMNGRFDAVLGLSVAENGFLDRVPVLPGGRYFSADDAREVIVTSSAADVLGITQENARESTLRFRGMDLEIVGILDDDRFRAIRDIDDKPLIPIQVEELTRRADEQVQEDVVIEEEDAGSGVVYVDMSALLLMPIDTVKGLEGQKPFSISVRFDNDEPVWPKVEDLLQATKAKFYVSSRVPIRFGEERGREVAPGVYFVGSGYRTSIGGLTVLLIPLLIASTIILNTMLGSVYERKAEISIYNAVGLNPTHIGMFFLAEAFVYSVIGSVGGYLIGQVLSIVISHFDLVSGINLNFSSLSVVYVILFTVSVVLLSTLYPAHVATKAAVPSGKRKWSMPENDGTHMRVAFPFIYQENLLPGIMAYLEEYFARFTEASLGDLIAAQESKQAGRDAQGRPVYEMAYHVALAPFDLGVTQRVTFRGAYDEKVQAYRVFMDVERLSGQDTNWQATNKPVLEKLRQYLMHWRNQNPERHAAFVDQGKASFGVEA